MAVRLVVRHPKSVAGEAGEISFEFEQARVVIGRGSGADVRLPGRGVSETHATIEPQGSRYALRDDGSTNGTRVEGVPLVARRPRLLADGDTFTIAEFTLTFFEGPLPHGPTLPERTASLARRMLRELLGGESAASQSPYLRVTAGSEAGTLLNFGEPPSRLVIGRDPECDLVVADRDVSRAHIELVRDADGVVGRDLESKNGLEVNGKRMRERRLRHGDVIRLGSATIVYQDPSEQALREFEREPVETLTHPQLAPSPEPEPPPAPREDHGDEAPQDEPSSETALESEGGRSPVDLMVYALAVFVLVASIVGLLWLFG